MAPHSGQRPTGQAHAPTAGRGLKRKAPNTPAGKAVASADPARLQGNTTSGRKPPTTSAGGKGGDKGKGSKPLEEGTGKGKAKAKVKSDIDDIFAGVKRLKEEKAEEEAARYVVCLMGRTRWTTLRYRCCLTAVLKIMIEPSRPQPFCLSNSLVSLDVL